LEERKGEESGRGEEEGQGGYRDARVEWEFLFGGRHARVSMFRKGARVLGGGKEMGKVLGRTSLRKVGMGMCGGHIIG